jgi:hypothetical protein
MSVCFQNETTQLSSASWTLCGWRLFNVVWTNEYYGYKKNGRIVQSFLEEFLRWWKSGHRRDWVMESLIISITYELAWKIPINPSKRLRYAKRSQDKMKNISL